MENDIVPPQWNDIDYAWFGTSNFMCQINAKAVSIISHSFSIDLLCDDLDTNGRTEFA